jgi:O-antigen/teichoic acid export membrane protein
VDRQIYSLRTVAGLLQALRARQGSFTGGSLITIGFNGVAMVMFLIGSLLVARALGPKQTGYLMWFITGTDTISRFADVIGIFYGNSYLVASRKHEGFDDAVIRGSVLGYGVVVGILAGFIFGCVPPVSSIVFYGFGERVWVVLICLNIFGLVLVMQIRGLLVGTKSFLLLGALNLVKMTTYAGFAIVIAYGLNWRVASRVATAQVISTWICVAILLVFLFARGVGRPAPSYLKKCIGVGSRGAGANVLSFLHLRADQYLVQVFLGPAALGLYGVAVWLGELITQVPAMLGMVLFPHVAAGRDQQRAFRATIKWTMITMLIVAVFMVPLALFSPPLVRLLYGEQFLAAVPLLRYYLPGVVILSGLYLINNHLAGLGYPAMYVIALALVLVVNIGLNLFLLPRIGVVGASISSSISYASWLTCVGGYLIYRSKKHSREELRAQ